MFGPDGVRISGLAGQRIVIDKSLSHEESFQFWQSYFEQKKLKVIEMSADEHDRLAANSQAVTHLIARILDKFGLDPTPIDTLSAQQLYKVKEQMSNDSWELFLDLQTLNPYCKDMRAKLSSAWNEVTNALSDAQKIVIK
jgi:prephenate dehydrogenase